MTKTTKITKEQKALLAPFGMMYAGMDALIRESSDDELKALLEACNATSTTNCWASSYYAAQFLKGEIAAEQSQRKSRAA